MTRTIRPLILVAILSSFLCTVCLAEYSVPVSPGGGIFDQPSTIANGTTVHVAFIGAPSLSGPFNVYYGAIYGGIDFTSPTLTQTTPGLFVTPSVIVSDNAAVPGDVYYDARHPKIALQTADKVVIFFQAKATSADTLFSLYRAQISLVNNAVTSISVKAVTSIPAGDVEDVSYGVVASDNTAMLAYSYRAGAAGPFDTYFARIGLDNAAVVRTPIRLSRTSGMTGSRPIPNLRLDGLNRAHIAWAVDNGTTGSFSAIYYAMVKEFVDPVRGNSDNAAIGATGIIGQNSFFGHPQVLVSPTTNSLVYLVATDAPPGGGSGNLAYVNINPDAAPQDNNSVNLGTNNLFLLQPPGMATIGDSYKLFRAEAHIDLGGRLHFTGYGNLNSAPLYYAVKTLATDPFFSFLVTPIPVVLGDSPKSFDLPGDYSKAAFAFLSTKGVVFWSGTDNTNSSNRALLVTGLPTITEYVLFNEKGCAASPGGRSGGLFDILWLAVPLVILKVRALIKRGRVAA